MTLSHHTRSLFVLLLAYWEEKFKKKNVTSEDIWGTIKGLHKRQQNSEEISTKKKILPAWGRH